MAQVASTGVFPPYSAKMGKRVAKEIRAEVVDKIQADERVISLAEQYGISTKTIYSWLRHSSGDDFGI